MKKSILSVLCSGAVLAAAFSVQATPKGTIFLTFDDGTVDATIPVVEILNEAGVKGTFYVNGWHLDGIADENEERALEALQLLLDTGHVVANHSYNHMVHNCVEEFGPDSAAECNATGNHQLNSYQDPVFDASMFDKNITVLASYIPDIDTYPNYKENLGRLPYTNSWRVAKEFTADGLCATSDDLKPWEPGYVCNIDNPSNSVKASIRVAEILANKNYLFHGWDLDWAPENWGIAMPANSLTEADQFLGYVDAALNACAPTTIEPINSKAQNFPCETPLHKDKVVVLTHDFLFEDGKRGMGATKNLPKLRKFLRIAQEAGYVFDTIDNYVPEWKVGTDYASGDYVSLDDIVYRATVDHTAQSDWAPSSQSSLWVNSMPRTIWTVNVSYNAGDLVTYKGVKYVVNAAHISQPGWTPDTEPTLFSEL